MTQDEMKVLVPARLKVIEKENDVKILYAAESGSRAWGFESPDSDFDIRFIYLRPETEYLRLNSVRDVIEIPTEGIWDISGWDLKKALRLLHNSNPGLYDWLGSPVCYLGEEFRERITPLMRSCFSKNRMLHHYFGIASRHVGDVFADSEVSPKKYFYALRSVLACIWINQQDSAPPVLFSKLTDAVLPAENRLSLQYIFDKKRSSPEKAKIERIEDIDCFLKEQIESAGKNIGCLCKEEQIDWEELDAFFLSELKQ